MKYFNWSDTNIWKLIEQEQNEKNKKLIHLVADEMDKIQSILNSGGTEGLDFTLHDANHSFRVANRMIELIPSITLNQLSLYDKILLLLSAYLHDIGMTPLRKTVSNHYSYIATCDKNLLTETEIKELQKWIDEKQEGISLPLLKDNPDKTQLKKLNKIVAHYCRHKHNDWSGDWIKSNLFPAGFAQYSNIKEDVTRICKSHHFGYNELCKSTYDPIIVDSKIVHLRYIATVLRIADVLEFDPERTPDVIFQHRDIEDSSIIFWAKDHNFNFSIENNTTPVLSARPKSAYLHKAVLDTANGVEEELKLAEKLSRHIPFDRCSLFSKEIPYKWSLSSELRKEISADQNSYEYIDGAFKPDAKKVLELLSGTRLYGSNYAAVREMIQNSFDAIKELVAYQRLQATDPKDKTLEANIAEVHYVNIEIRQEGTEIVFTCEDSGIGMTKEIIERYFLVGGKSTRHEILNLERECVKAGIEFSRTGNFGIGVLSYFMIGNNLRIETRRDIRSPSFDESAWSFEIGELDAFGELKKISKQTPGTKIQLNLKTGNLKSSTDEWITGLVSYLNKTLLRPPFNVSMNVNTSTLKLTKQWPRGWRAKKQHFTRKMLNQLMDSYNIYEKPMFADLVPNKLNDEYQSLNSDLLETEKDFKKSIRWVEKEFPLLGGKGYCKISFFYFNLAAGNCFNYLHIKKVNDEYLVKRIGRGYRFAPSTRDYSSWKGIATELLLSGGEKRRPFSYGSLYGNPNCFVQIDMLSSTMGELDVNRRTVSVNPVVLEEIELQIDSELDKIVKKIDFKSPSLGTLNNTIRSDLGTEFLSEYWLKIENEKIAKLAKVNYPAIGSVTIIYDELNVYNYSINGRTLSVIPGFMLSTEKDHYHALHWKQGPPDKILLFNQYTFRVNFAPVWEAKGNLGVRPKDYFGWYSQFPPNLSDLCGVSFENYNSYNSSKTIWNPENILVKNVSGEHFREFTSKFQTEKSPLLQKDLILHSRQFASMWLLLMVSSSIWSNAWEALIELNESFLKDVFIKALGEQNERKVVNFFVQEGASYRLRSISSKFWRTTENRDEIFSIIGQPPSDWTITSDQNEELNNNHRPRKISSRASPKRRRMKGVKGKK